jgi:hypothetical protein
MKFCTWGIFFEGGPRVHRSPLKSISVAESLRNTGPACYGIIFYNIRTALRVGLISFTVRIYEKGVTLRFSSEGPLKFINSGMLGFSSTCSQPAATYG